MLKQSLGSKLQHTIQWVHSLLVPIIIADVSHIYIYSFKMFQVSKVEQYLAVHGWTRAVMQQNQRVTTVKTVTTTSFTASQVLNRLWSNHGWAGALSAKITCVKRWEFRFPRSAVMFKGISIPKQIQKWLKRATSSTSESFWPNASIVHLLLQLCLVSRLQD